jgi:hypothetical protein
MIRLLHIAVPFGFIATGWSQGQYLMLLMGALLLMGTLVRDLLVRFFLWHSVAWCLFLQVMVVFSPFHGPIASRTALFCANLLLGMAVYVAVARSKVPKRAFFDIICIGAILQVAVGLSQLLDLDPIFWLMHRFTGLEYGCQRGLATGTLTNTNYLAAYLAISTPFFFRRWWCLFLPAVAYLLVISNTTTAVVSLAAGVIFYFQQWWILFAGSAFALVFMLFIDSNPVFDNPRFSIWGGLLPKMIVHPVEFTIGYSPGAQTGLPFPLHSEWLELLYRYGLIGVFNAMLYAKGAIIGTDKMLASALVIAMVNCLGNHPLHLPPSVFLILMIMGLIERDKWLTSLPTKTCTSTSGKS